MTTWLYLEGIILSKISQRKTNTYVVLEKTLESPLDCKEIKPVHPNGNQPWIFIGRTDAEVEAPVLWPLDVKSWLSGKDPDAGKDGRREEKGQQRIRCLDNIIDSMDMSSCKLWEMVKNREAWCAAVHGVTKSWTWPSKWTTTFSLAHTKLPVSFFSSGHSPLKSKYNTAAPRLKKKMPWITEFQMVCTLVRGNKAPSISSAVIQLRKWNL